MLTSLWRSATLSLAAAHIAMQTPCSRKQEVGLRFLAYSIHVSLIHLPAAVPHLWARFLLVSANR